MNAARRRELFERFKALNPAPVTELEHTTPFELLIAVILSAQATDKGVNLATRKLFPVANTPAALLALGPEGLASYVRTIGLYPGKVKNILATCAILLEKYGGAVPQDREALEALPGVGRKTANVVLNSAFASRRCQSTRTSFASRTGSGWPAARTRARSKTSCCSACRRNTCSTRITGCCCTAGTSARRASRIARSVPWSTCASTNTRRCLCPRPCRS